MQISTRLKTVASFVSEGCRVADIGTDHAYIPINLIKEGRIPSALAMDINPGPLKRARAHIIEEGLEGVIETRLSDGLSAYQCKEADSIVIAGIGGEMMVRILKEGKEKLFGIRELVLSPHSEIEKVRRHLMESGFIIQDETMLIENEKYYTVLRAESGIMQLTETELFYGRCLLLKKDPVLFLYLNRELSITEQILSQIPSKKEGQRKRRSEELKEKVQRIQEALGYYESI